MEISTKSITRIFVSFETIVDLRAAKERDLKF
jgi:hypothetical protein